MNDINDRVLSQEEINTKIENMSVEEMSRWCSLLDAISLIEEECEERKTKKDSLRTKPIQKYIEATSSVYMTKFNQMERA